MTVFAPFRRRRSCARQLGICPPSEGNKYSSCICIQHPNTVVSFCERLLDDKQTKRVRSLLEDNTFLLEQSRKHLELAQQKVRAIFDTIAVIRRAADFLQLPQRNGMLGELSLHALSGTLQDKPILQDLLAASKTLDSLQKLEDFLAILPPNAEILEMREDITQVPQLRANKRDGRRTVEYIDRLHDIVQAYFATNLVNPQDLFLHEVLLFDLRSPLKDVFVPKSRFAIERALYSPFDYLVSTSDTQTGRLSAKQPASSILYQLYLESGALVNVYDLWQTFLGVFEGAQGGDCDDRMVMTLFYRALSELKGLGMIKNSRRKTDHIVKLAWPGL